MPRGALIKISKTEYVQDFFENGTLFMNTLNYFQNLESIIQDTTTEQESNDGRFDHHDGIDELQTDLTAEMVLDDGSKLFFDTCDFGFNRSDTKLTNLFCMYHVNDGSFPIDVERMCTEFGESSVVIKRPQEFQNRIRATLKESALPAKANIVEYYDDDYSGMVGPFKKHKRFEVLRGLAYVGFKKADMLV